MDLIQTLQEQYFREFTERVPIDEFIINILVTAALAALLRWYFVRFGNAMTNRRRFASNFLPLALGTMLIIMVVRSSIALSLGLVGALSIVRFRAAIKEPEELTFLFLIIGVGLAGGANQTILAVVAVVSILIILYVSRRLESRVALRKDDKVFINISTDLTDLSLITTELGRVFDFVDLKRMDTSGSGLELSFLCRVNDLSQIAEIQKTIVGLSSGTQLSIIDHPEW